MTFYFICTTT